jgi:hypothetical protein
MCTGIPELLTVDLNINRIVLFRMAFMNQVMYGNHRLYSCFINAHRYLVTQPVIEAYIEFFEIRLHPTAAPG